MVRQSVSGLESGVESCEQRYFVGVDVHKRSYSVTLRTAERIIKRWSTTASPAKLVQTLESLGPDADISLAYEAGPTGFGLARCARVAGIEVVVAAPSKVPRPVNRRAKTDRLDSDKLADLLARGLLKSIAIPTPEQERQRGVIRQRQQLVMGIRRAKQRIKSYLLLHGIEEPTGLAHWSKASVQALEAMDLPEESRLVLGCQLRILAMLEGERDHLDRELKGILEQKEHCEVVERLQSVPGVGPVVAGAFRLEIFSPERFHSSEEVASLVGLAPTVHQSGDGKARSWLPKAGNNLLRSLMIQAAWRWQAADPKAHEYYARIMSRTGVQQKAVVALARKLVVLLWRLSIGTNPYQQAI